MNTEIPTGISGQWLACLRLYFLVAAQIAQVAQPMLFNANGSGNLVNLGSKEIQPEIQVNAIM